MLSLPSRECGLKYSQPLSCHWYRSSLPSRECGLKFSAIAYLKGMHDVTPFAGVWIEIAIRTIFDSKCCRSLPSRECGLKYLSYLLCFILWPSLPSRECGLKSVPFVLLLSPFVVTPFAGVWIEITWVPNL